MNKFICCIAKKSNSKLCTKYRSGDQFCQRHYCQFLGGIINEKGEKLVHLNYPYYYFTECQAKNKSNIRCSKYTLGKRFCDRHNSQFSQSGIIDLQGNNIRNYKYQNYGKMTSDEFSECLAKNSDTGYCTKYKKRSRFCSKHRRQFYRSIIDINGEKLQDLIYAGKTSHLKPVVSGTNRQLFKTRNNLRGREEFDHCFGKDAGTGECSTRIKKHRFCSKHNKQFDGGIIDYNGNKLRDLRQRDKYKLTLIKSPCKTQMNVLSSNSFSECQAKNKSECTTYIKGKRFCAKHMACYKRGIVDYNGNNNTLFDLQTSTRKYSFSECQAKNKSECTTYIKGKRFCAKHFGYYHSGIINLEGERTRLLAKEIVCKIPGCNMKGGYKTHLCKRHYKEIVVRQHFESYLSLNPILNNTLKQEQKHWSL